MLLLVLSNNSYSDNSVINREQTETSNNTDEPSDNNLYNSYNQKDSKIINTKKRAENDQHKQYTKSELEQKYKEWQDAIETPQDANIVFNFFYNNPHWPLFHKTVKQTEKYLQNIDVSLITKWFSNYSPMTKEGIETYIKCLKEEDKIKYIKQTWIFQNLEIDYLEEFRKKYEQYIEDIDDALKIKRVAAENNSVQLIKLQKIIKNKTILDYINRALHSNEQFDQEIMNNASKRYTYIQQAINKNDYHEASKILVLTNDGEETILLANKYYELRRKVAYFMLKAGEPRIAYVVAKKCKTKGENKARLEWLQGFITYRFTNQINLSKKHFQSGYDYSKKSIRLSKNAFWLAEVYLSQKDVIAATEWYQKAAQHFSTFYGFLAEQRLKNISQTYKTNLSINQSISNKFNDRELVQVLKNINIDEKYRKYFYLSLVYEIDDPYEELLLIDLAKDNNELDLITENFNKKQHYTDKSYKVLHDNVNSIKNVNDNSCFISTVHSVIKRESSFNTKAKSPAGARGLMQLMPLTAKETAKELDLKISNKDLYNKEINLTLGSTLLNNLMKKYDDNLVYALYAYNAGVGNLKRYTNITKNLKHLNVLEIIELIPIKETRIYIKNVLVNKFNYDQIFDCQYKDQIIESILADNV